MRCCQVFDDGNWKDVWVGTFNAGDDLRLYAFIYFISTGNSAAWRYPDGKHDGHNCQLTAEVNAVSHID